MRICMGWWLALVVALSFPAHSQQIVVRAVDTDFTGGPLSAPMGRPTGGTDLVLVDEAGTRAPAQWVAEEAGGRLWWWQPPLERGQRTTWQLDAGAVPASPERGVQVIPETAGAEVRIGGQLFTHYITQGAPKPYCWPLMGPNREPVTRAYPMADVEGEARDHPHHRSFWFTHGEVNGVDFWSESDRAGRTVHREFLQLESGPVLGLLKAHTDWLAADDSKVCEDVRQIRFYRVPNGHLLDFEVTLRATEGEVVLGDTKEGSFGFRVTAPIKLNGGQGHILNATGQRDGDTWGQRAEWCDYYGPLGGETIGIAIFDHPENLRHPTYWHVRDYGLFAANPFGLRHFINAEPGTGNVTIPAGGELTLRYRVWIHQGDPERVGMARHYQSFIRPPQVEIAR